MIYTSNFFHFFFSSWKYCYKGGKRNSSEIYLETDSISLVLLTTSINKLKFYFATIVEKYFYDNKRQKIAQLYLSVGVLLCSNEKSFND